MKTVEEWVFAAWTADGTLGLISGHRIVGSTAWYWAALARAGRPLLHITDFEVPVRADPFVVKGEAMWAEHFRDASMEQWTIGNETYASALDDADEALGRGYGIPTPIAFDLEWYSSATPFRVDDPHVDGYEQSGNVLGTVEILGEPSVELADVPAWRWHRWVTAPTRDDVAEASSAMGPIPVPTVAAHTGIRAPFAFPNGSTLDLVLTPQGWSRRET